MIAQSDALAEVAAREARSTDFDQFSLRATHLLAAAQHFKAVSVANTRSKRSWWHGWARDFAFEVRRVLIRNGIESPGFSNPTSQGITITLELLKLASISDIDPTALIAALKQKTKRKLKKVS